MCAENGIFFDPFKKQTHSLFAFEIEEVSKALEVFQKRGGKKTDCFGKPLIPNPQGFIISCLKDAWWDDEKLDEGLFSQLLTAFGFDKKNANRADG